MIGTLTFFNSIVPLFSQVSDDFNDTGLDTNLWTFVDPLEDAILDTSGLALSISVPSGISHDMWTSGFNAPRVMQTVSNTDFEIEAKFQSEISQKFQSQGIFVEQDATNALRFDVYSDGSNIKLFAASFSNSSASIKINATIAAGSEYYLRVERFGDIWTLSYSYDRTNWIVGISFNHSLIVSKVGVFAGNSGNNPPAFTGIIDYVFNTASPIEPEDDGQFSLMTNVSGNGTVTRNPSSDIYSSGGVVELTAVPDPNWEFVGWSGDITGTSNPVNLTVSKDHNTTANFVYNPPPPEISTFVSDDFNDAELDVNVWTFVDPRADAIFDTSGLSLSIEVPAGISHDMWIDGFYAPRIMQTVNNADFEVEAKFQSEVTQKYQSQGIFIEQDTANALRFDVYSDGSNVKLFAASLSNGSAIIKTNATIAAGSEYYLRVERVGDVWTLLYSYDGVNWLFGVSFTSVLDVSGVGVFAGNSGSNTPAFTAIVDYVFNAASPINPEDEGLFSLVTYASGNGTVTRNPSSDIYSSGDVVELTAVPDPNWEFIGWSGDVTSTSNPVNLMISEDASVTANFVFNPPPPEPTNLTSDDFNDPTLNANLWTFIDPLGDTLLDLNGRQLTLSIAQGVSHGIWRNDLSAPRIMQQVNDSDFEFEVKFESSMNKKYQSQGILVESDAGEFLRFDVFSDGSQVSIFAAHIFGSVAKEKINQPIISSNRYYLRVARSGDEWTYSYSYDGTGWIQLESFVEPFNVSAIGFYVGNEGVAPAFSSTIDYAFNTESPIMPEDDGQVTLSVVASGNGTFTINPDQEVYQLGDEVVLTATPDPRFWDFNSWSGDTASIENPVSIVIDGDMLLNANFDYNPPASTLVSEYFSNTGSTLPQNWSATDPLGDSSIAVVGNNLEIYVPEGTNHDLWTGRLDAPRVLQVCNDTDFECEVKFLTPVIRPNQTQGIIVEQDSENFLRFDVFSTGEETRIFAASFSEGIGSSRFNKVISGNLNYFLRVKRVLDQWTLSYSYDGTSWTEAGNFIHEINVTAAGLFAGNSTITNYAPEFTSVVDYFVNTATSNMPPSEPVEGAIITSVSGNGTITKSPDQDIYTAGQSVELTAIPDPGWSFVGWSGGISGTNATESISVSDDHTVQAVFAPTGPDAVINLWYGDNQQFGQLGIPQVQANLLGSINLLGEIIYMYWSLGGVFQGYLSIGPNSTRLANIGDFNIEIPFSDLQEGSNQITITAVAFDGTEYSRNANVQYYSSNFWPSDYSIDWSTVSNITDVAQIVDGKWTVDQDGVRTVEPGYDRVLAIGDIDWYDYEVTVPVTVHSIDETKITKNAPAVGVLMRWDGHEKRREEQPGILWYEMGSIGWYRWYDGAERFELLGNPTEGSTRDTDGTNLQLGVRYIFKIRVETVEGQVAGTYKFKYWEDGQAEPESYQLVRESNFQGGLLKGSCLLVAHYADATFGNVTIESIEQEPTTGETLPEFSGGAVSITTRGGGSISKTPDQATYNGYETVTLTANPEPGWEFVGWSGVGGVSLDINSVDVGLSAYRIDTPVATYYLEKTGAGLSSLLDQNDNDWIGFSPIAGTGSSGEFRGFPNAVFNQNGSSFFHALNGGTDPSTCIVTVLDPDLVSIEVVSGNGEWEGRYDFTPTHCTFTMTKAPVDGNYWVLYEGVPGGSFDSTDWWMTSDNSTKQLVTTPRSGDISAPEWMAFGDPNLNRSLVLYHHENDSFSDDYYALDNAMTVFGFGRSGNNAYLQSIPQSFTIALVESDDHSIVDEAVENFRLDYAGVPLYETTTDTVSITVTRDHNIEALFVPINNTSPTVTAISDQQAAVDTTVGPLSITVGDAESPSSDLILTASSSNQTLIENGNIIFSGEGDTRTVSLVPTQGMTGSAVITIYVDDGGLASTTSFNVTFQ